MWEGRPEPLSGTISIEVGKTTTRLEIVLPGQSKACLGVSAFNKDGSGTWAVECPDGSTGKGVFQGLPSPFTATRYHSLIVERSTLPDCLEITAETADGVIMGLQHKQFSVHGVQFHPESIATEGGMQILKNFLTLS